MRIATGGTGKRAVSVPNAPDQLDVTASRTDDKLFLHVINTDRTRGVPVQLAAQGVSITAAKVFEIAVLVELTFLEGLKRLHPHTCYSCLEY